MQPQMNDANQEIKQMPCSQQNTPYLYGKYQNAGEISMEKNLVDLQNEMLVIKNRVSQRLSMLLQLWSVSMANGSGAAEATDLSQRATLLSNTFSQLSTADLCLQDCLHNMSQMNQLDDARQQELKS